LGRIEVTGTVSSLLLKRILEEGIFDRGCTLRDMVAMSYPLREIMVLGVALGMVNLYKVECHSEACVCLVIMEG
jgi:hypothetical protein